MSATAEALPTPTARWDLSALFSGMDDPKIETSPCGRSLRAKRADAFEKAYRGKLEEKKG